MGIPDKGIHKRQDGFRYNGAVFQVIDWSQKKIIKEVSYTSPPQNLGNGLSMQFKGASIYNNKYYIVTNTELLIYDLANLSLEKVITLPSFNDLHGVLLTTGCIYICNTGLEIVQVLDHEGQLIKGVNMASVPTYERFDIKKDWFLTQMYARF